MGNVNGRKDGNDGGGGGGGSPSGVRVGFDEEEGGVDGGGGGSGQENMVAHDGSFPSHGQPPELMGHSPPRSPMPALSPFMFTPQVPVVPLQRPDEMHAPNHLWMETTSGYEDTCDEQGIPTMFTWSYGGKEVAIEGSWDNWKTRKLLQRSGKDFIIMKVLPSGVYQYKFIVDGQWRYAPELPWAQDDMGHAYNILDLQEYVPEDLESISGFEPPQSPDSSYNSLQLGSEDFAKEPPLVPPHLQMTLLNEPSSQMAIPPPLSRPQHVVLNHLYMQKGRSGPSVVALGSTHRFHSKYVTVVLYKSLQREDNKPLAKLIIFSSALRLSLPLIDEYKSYVRLQIFEDPHLGCVCIAT